MKPALSLVTNESAPPAKPIAARPFLTIVKALALDSVKLPTKKKSSKKVSKRGALLANASNGGPIPESGRNNTLTSLAGSMRQKGMDEASILAALKSENLARCAPPLDESEVEGIVASIMRYPAGSSVDVLKTLNDTGNADRFGERYKGQVKYVPGVSWLIWNELRWGRDDCGEIIELAKTVARAIYIEAGVANDDSVRSAISLHAAISLKAPRLSAMLSLAQSLPEIVTLPAQLDKHDMSLGVANGVVDLKTGKLQPVHPDLLLTRHSPVAFEPSAKCPQFLTFIDQITGGDKALAHYLQRVVGYTLTGDTSEQCLFFLYGSGANGKSTFLNVIKELLGNDLASQTPSETLMVKRSEATNDIARLQGVRAVIANEIEDGSLMAESLVKQMTGGEALTARFHYQEFFQFTPKFKLFIAGNHKPVIRGRDNGIWRRIRLIPFETVLAKAQQDPKLQEKLRSELPGILNWAIKGCKDWQKQGLAESKTITEAVKSYRSEMDILGTWEADSCTVGPGLETSAAVAYQSYRFWAESNGYKPMSSGSFGRELADRFKRIKRKEGNYYLGFKAK